MLIPKTMKLKDAAGKEHAFKSVKLVSPSIANAIREIAKKLAGNAKLLSEQQVDVESLVNGVRDFADKVENKGFAEREVKRAYAKIKGITLPKKSGRAPKGTKGVAVDL